MCWIRYRVSAKAFAELFDGAFMADDVAEQFSALIDNLLMVLSALSARRRRTTSELR
jgi:hypothetical protein